MGSGPQRPALSFTRERLACAGNRKRALLAGGAARDARASSPAACGSPRQIPEPAAAVSWRSQSSPTSASTPRSPPRSRRSPRRTRAQTGDRAIVALEVLFDYLDGRTEQPTRGPDRRGSRAVRAVHRALGTRTSQAAETGSRRTTERSRAERLGLPGGPVPDAPASSSPRCPPPQRSPPAPAPRAERCAQAQTRIHAGRHARRAAAPRVGRPSTPRAAALTGVTTPPAAPPRCSPCTR